MGHLNMPQLLGAYDPQRRFILTPAKYPNLRFKMVMRTAPYGSIMGPLHREEAYAQEAGREP